MQALLTLIKTSDEKVFQYLLASKVLLKQKQNNLFWSIFAYSYTKDRFIYQFKSEKPVLGKEELSDRVIAILKHKNINSVFMNCLGYQLDICVEASGAVQTDPC